MAPSEAHESSRTGVEPQRLWLVASRGADIQGEYSRQRGRDKHGQAIWRQVSGAGWLFSSGPEGFWCFARKECDIGNKLGQVQSVVPHQGRLPHQIAEWQYHDWSTWCVDQSICVTACREEFRRANEALEALRGVCAEGDRLWIVAPPYAALQGEYAKQLGRLERGQPVWSQVNGTGTLFSTAKGRWFIADSDAGIALNGGVIATAARHDGRPPQDIAQWQCFHRGKWLADPSILATTRQEEVEERLTEQEVEASKRAAQAPEHLWLVCLPKLGLQGEYLRQHGRVERGEAIWHQVDGHGVLFSNGVSGFWCFAIKEADVMRNVGILQSSTPHAKRPPHEVAEWHYADGGAWMPDSGIFVTASVEVAERAFAVQLTEARLHAQAAPESLSLLARAQPALEGVYIKQGGRLERGQACWRQAGGEGWLYSTAGGRWFVADCEEAIADCSGVIASAGPHHGRPPQESTNWQRYSEGTWHADASVLVTASKHVFGTAGEKLGEDTSAESPDAHEAALPVCVQTTNEPVSDHQQPIDQTTYCETTDQKASDQQQSVEQAACCETNAKCVARVEGLGGILADAGSKDQHIEQADEPRMVPGCARYAEPEGEVPVKPHNPEPERQPPGLLGDSGVMELRARIRTEVQRLLSIAGLVGEELSQSMDRSVLIEECLCVLLQDEQLDQGAIERAVLRSLLVSKHIGRRGTCGAAGRGTTQEWDDLEPPWSCRLTGPRACLHVKAEDTLLPEIQIKTDAPGCLEPFQCSVLGNCFVS